MKYLAGPDFSLKVMEFGAFCPYFHILGTLKWYNFFNIVPKNFIFDKLSDKKKNTFEDIASGFKISC